MDSLQNLLSEYLQSELCHILGSYRVADERLYRVAQRLREDYKAEVTADYYDKPEAYPNEVRLFSLADSEGRYNRELGRNRHASPPLRAHGQARSRDSTSRAWPERDPVPSDLPLTKVTRFDFEIAKGTHINERVHRWRTVREWGQVPTFYSQAIDALLAYDRGAKPTTQDQWYTQMFAESLIAPRDGASGVWGDRAWLERRRRRIHRYMRRRQQAHEWMAPEGRNQPVRSVGIIDRVGRAIRAAIPPNAAPVQATDDSPLWDAYQPSLGFLKEIATSHLGEGDHPFPLFVIRAQAEAHLSMHAVEAWQSMCVGDHAEMVGKDERKWLSEELDQSIALSTFAYCVSRTAPWIFAEHQTECEGVFEHYASAWENLVPARCMWIAAQVGLLALHRRAYAYSLKGDAVQSYNDYHKLQRLIRDTDRRVRAAPIHVEGALDFLAGLDAEAHHHIGELYRSQHAHKPALEHFEAASYRLEGLRKGDPVKDRRKDERMKEILTNSRWYVELQISRGKASYEMGRHKQALSWHLHAWRALLELIAADTRTETSTKAIDEAITWLDRVKFEPELRKSEVSERIGRVVDQLDRITVIDRFGALAAEILLRLGHLLFVLNVGYERNAILSRATEVPPTPAAREALDRAAGEQIRRTLAFACLVKAAECDQHSTLVGADLLKARFRFNSWLGGELDADHAKRLKSPQLAPIDEQWPRGGDDYEQLARVAEYLMLKARIDRFEEHPSPGETERATDGFVARDLLLSLFMSTDSINVRKSQIHRFLMEPESDDPAPIADRAPAIELVCMRRYSSPFPLLPRPSAFRALGGGYFVRLHPRAREHHTGEQTDGGGNPGRGFGIVVDPGVDFVENLYRTGYSLSDVHMIVLTHDHVDHLGALDPLLSLIHVRSELLDKQAQFDESGPGTRKVRVLTSESVDWRYERVERLVKEESLEFEFACFQEMADENGMLDCSNAFFTDFPQGFEIVVMSSAAGQGDDGGHLDLSRVPSHGLCFRVVGENGPSVALTSDTPPPPVDKESDAYRQWRDAWAAAIEADVLVVHLGSVPLTELRRIDQLGEGEEAQNGTRGDSPSEGLHEDEAALLRIQDQLQEAEGRLRGQIEYAQWLRSHLPDKDDPPLTAALVGSVSPHWSPPQDHNYLAGVLSWAREYLAVHERPPSTIVVQAVEQSTVESLAVEEPWGGQAPEEPGRAGLFIVGELSEELGTMRSKVATRLNERIFKVREQRDELGKKQLGKKQLGNGAREEEAMNEFSYALTADIGLHVCVSSAAPLAKRKVPSTKVLCTTCDLDTDRAPNERYHIAHDVYEVCVKGENEGIFYNCLEHDPARQDDPTFLEQLERFDIFGR